MSGSETERFSFCVTGWRGVGGWTLGELKASIFSSHVVWDKIEQCGYIIKTLYKNAESAVGVERGLR